MQTKFFFRFSFSLLTYYIMGMKNYYYFMVVVISFLLSYLIDQTISLIISRDPNKIRFLLYPNASDYHYYEEIRYLDEASLRRTQFKDNIFTVIMTHGFLDSADPNIVTLPVFFLYGGIHNVTQAYLYSGIQGNFLVVDWGPLAGYITSPADILPLYFIAMSNIPIVARRITDFMLWLYSLGALDLTKVHCLGHSLGAHVMGYVGRYVQNSSLAYSLPRITGLDPSGPFYYPPNPLLRLDSSVAQFVDAIHTNLYEYGDKGGPDGHVDSFPNGGVTQPGCDPASDVLFCSHLYVWKLYAATFHNNYKTCKCNRTLTPVELQECMNVCPEPVPIGVYVPHTARGEYYSYTPPLPRELI